MCTDWFEGEAGEKSGDTAYGSAQGNKGALFDEGHFLWLDLDLFSGHFDHGVGWRFVDFEFLASFFNGGEDSTDDIF